MQFANLTCHPAVSNPPAIEIEAIALVLPTDAISFRYHIRGDIDRIRVPDSGPPSRTDELWRHTCFEAFVKPKSSERYFEFNFAPSSSWAAYSFDSFRLGMQPVPAIKPPTIQWHKDDDGFSLEATVRMKSLRFDSAIGLSAVIEDVDGKLSFWALAHPREKPDFHESAGWTNRFQRFTA